jgi:hypothetical protein
MYRATDMHVHDLRLEGGHWIQADMLAIITNPPSVAAAGNPFVYVSPDGISRVVYRGIDNDIHDLRLEGGHWIQADISAIVVNNPPAVAAAGNPFAYVSPDGLPRVVYRGVDRHIHDLRLENGRWIKSDILAIIANPPFVAAD